MNEVRQLDLKFWTAEEAAVWDYLCEHGHGRMNAISRKELASFLETDVRVVSEIVKRLIEDRSKLIGTDSAGIWIPSNRNEAERAIRNIEHRLISLAVRVKKLRCWTDEEFTDQIRILMERNPHR